MQTPKEGFLDDIGGGEAPATDPAPSPEPEKAPETASEAPPAADDPSARADGGKRKASPAAAPDRPDGYVPKQALDEARISHREEIRRERERADRTEAALQRWLDRSYGGDEQQTDPDIYNGPADDPLAKLQWLEDRETQRIQASRQHQQQEQQRQHQEAAFNDLVTKVRTEYQAAAAADPEIEGAYNAVYNSYAQELQALGWQGQQLTEQLRTLEAQHIAWAAQQSQPIGEFLTKLAQARGWKRGQAQAPANGQANGAQPLRDPDTGKFVENAQRLAESQERNASLSQAPGAPVRRLQAKEFAQMPEEEQWKHFKSIMRRPGRKQFESDMGFKP